MNESSADALTQEALSHWYVRLLANGISYIDASEVIPKVSSWHEWCRLWMEHSYPLYFQIKMLWKVAYPFIYKA